MAQTIDVTGKTVYDGPPADEEEVERRILDAARGHLGRLETQAVEQVRLKSGIEERWLEDLRNYYGRYAPEIEKDLKEDERSRAFVKLTRHKTNGWAARLSDLLLPTDDRNWGIEPTPLPKLAQAAKQAQDQARAAVAAANDTADQADAQQDPAQKARAAAIAQQADAFAQAVRQTEGEIEEAKKRAARMQEAIDDQLTESDYAAQCRDVLEDGCRLGTGVLKGPLTSNRVRNEWRKEGNAPFQLAQISDPQPEFKRVDPWHFFPDMSARTIAEAEYTYERSLPTKRDLRRYAAKLGFNKEAVRRLIKDGPPLLGSSVDHITHLREITNEGEAITDRYIMWEYHGPLECAELCDLLRAAGDLEGAEYVEKEQDELREYRVIVFFCNGEVLKIEPEYPLDSGDTLYSVWNFEKGETSMFGIGIPHIMADSQRAINAAWRMTMDNSGLSVGPQILVNKQAIEPENGSYAMKALKVWLLDTTALTSTQVPPFQVFNIPNNQKELQGIIEMGKMFADEETSMPLIAQGEQGAASQTLGGMSMLFNSANVVFRRVVKSFDDDLTKPTIRRAYDWNMQFNPDESLKGDMQVDARGSSVLLVREIQSQNLMNIMTNWTVHPVIGNYMKVHEGLTKALQTMMIAPDELLYGQDEADRRSAEAQERQAAAAAQNQPAPDQGASPAELRIKVAEIETGARIQIAEMQRELKIMELAQREGLSLEETRTKLQIKQIDAESKERQFAGKVAVEAQRREESPSIPAPQVVGEGIG